MIQMEIVVRAAPDVQTAATRRKSEFDIPRTLGKDYVSVQRDRCLFCCRSGLVAFTTFSVQIAKLELFFKLPERRIDRDALGKDVHVSLDIDWGQSFQATVVDVVDRRRQDLGLEPLSDLGRSFRMRAPFNLQS